MKFEYKNQIFSLMGPKGKYRSNFRDIEQLETLGKYTKPGFVYLDCGANIGNHSIYFSKVLKAGHVYGFEPIQKIYNIYQENIKRNGIENISPINFGVSAEKGELKCFSYIPDQDGAFWFWYDGKIDMNDPSVYHKRHKEYNKELIVRSVAIDDMFTDTRIEVLKIDVEGMEIEALKGAENVIYQNSPLICIEVFKGNMEKFEQWMKENNYKRIEQNIFKYPNILCRRK